MRTRFSNIKSKRLNNHYFYLNKYNCVTLSVHTASYIYIWVCEPVMIIKELINIY